MSSEEKGQNVKVVLRCRPMSASEKAKEKPAVKCVGDKSVEINYNTLGKASKKAFAFDGVYDPSTSQKDIYDNVVRPVVDEVLQGYNCTVFAYGQTGTGKTYTMEGQFADSKNKQEQPHAGIVPRAVAQVFQYLEEADLEYQVRISVVELYNEELSDLIAAGDDEKIGNLRKLRLLEDPKKGIVLQGVEERPVNTAGEIFHILEGTNKHRKTAETLCNKQSSRSHSIFTLKIFMKERALDEEEVIKTGLLHLVDLAGSECVGRSGAQGDRKKEAGQINQSLLTLGRVITALVEHQPHVPYRESKLTRLLQESLGGKTKTCIIATVSPGSSNIEETLSTLDYACRAKNIKNTPEINQVSTKKTMMKDMAKSISDLQEQLKAQREANGVYLPQGKYEGMQEEIDKLKSDELVLQQELEEKQKQFEELQNSFSQTVQELQQTQLNLEQTQGALEDTQVELVGTQQTLVKTEYKLEDVSVVLSEHKSVGQDLYSEGVELLSTSESMKSDLSGLFGKLSRKSQVETSNLAVAAGYTSEVQQQLNAATNELASFKDDQAGRFKALQRQVADFVVEKQREMTGIHALLAALHTLAGRRLEEGQERQAEAAAVGKAAVESATAEAGRQREETKGAVDAGAEEAGRLLGVLREEVAQCSASVEAWGNSVACNVSGSMERVQAFASAQDKRLAQLAAAAAAADDKHQRGIAEQEDAVGVDAVKEAAALAAVEAKVMEGVRALLSSELGAYGAVVDANRARVKGGLGEVREGMAEASECLQAGVTQCRGAASGLWTAMKAGGEEQLRQSEASRAGAVGQLAGCDGRAEEVQGTVAECQREVGRRQEAQKEALVEARRQQQQALDMATAEAERALGAAGAELKAAVEGMEGALRSAGESAGERGEAASRAVDEQAEAMQRHYITAQAQMTRMAETPLPLRRDEPTGMTPVKKEIALPSALPRFRPDDLVLAEYRGYEYKDGERVGMPAEEGVEEEQAQGEEGRSEEGGADAEGGEGEGAMAMGGGGGGGGTTPAGEQESGLKRWSGGSAQAAERASSGSVNSGRASGGSETASEAGSGSEEAKEREGARKEERKGEGEKRGRSRSGVREKTLSRIPSLRTSNKENRNTLNANS